MSFRSARLTTILGAPPESVTYEQLAALVGNDAAREAEDLDYKERYEPGDKGSDDIAVDVATFANHIGGVIVVGMADANARPSKAVGVELTDALERRIRTCVANRVFPLPRFDLRPVPDPADTGNPRHGFLLIMVPRSPLAPHAVVDPREKNKLRWPRRHGSGKIWMSESELAAAYRRRFVEAAARGERLATVEDECLQAVKNHKKLPPRGTGGLLIVSLVPDEPGDLIIDREQYNRFSHEIAQQPVRIGSTRRNELHAVGVGPRRFIAESPRPDLLVRTELHTDGAGAVAVHVLHIGDFGGPSEISDLAVVEWTASALRLLARHAREWTGASGTAVVSASLRAYAPVLNDRPRLGREAIIVAYDPAYCVFGKEPQSWARGEASFLLDDLADDGKPLALATERLVSDLFQAFNAIGTRQITRDGELVLSQWGSSIDAAQQWAVETGIPTV